MESPVDYNFKRNKPDREVTDFAGSEPASPTGDGTDLSGQIEVEEPNPSTPASNKSSPEGPLPTRSWLGERQGWSTLSVEKEKEGDLTPEATGIETPGCGYIGGEPASPWSFELERTHDRALRSKVEAEDSHFQQHLLKPSNYSVLRKRVKAGLAESGECLKKGDLVLVWTQSFDDKTSLTLKSIPAWRLGIVKKLVRGVGEFVEIADCMYVSVCSLDKPFNVDKDAFDLLLLNKARVMDVLSDPTSVTAGNGREFFGAVRGLYYPVDLGGSHASQQSEMEFFLGYKLREPDQMQLQAGTLVSLNYMSGTRAPQKGLIFCVMGLIVHRSPGESVSVLICDAAEAGTKLVLSQLFLFRICGLC